MKPDRARIVRAQKPAEPDRWLEVVEIIDRSLEHGSVRLGKLKRLIQTGLNLTEDDWQRFCLARPDLICRINRSYAERMLKVEGGVLKQAEESPDFGLSVLKLVDPEYMPKGDFFAKSSEDELTAFIAGPDAGELASGEGGAGAPDSGATPS